MSNESQRTIKNVALIFSIILIICIIAAFVKFFLVGISFFTDEEYNMDNSSEFMVEVAVDDLDISVATTDFNIKLGDEYKIETNNKYVTFGMKKDKLVVKEKSHFVTNDSKTTTTLYIPYDTKFNNVVIDTGAGKVNISDFSCDYLDLDLGAGIVNINNITTQNTNLDAGAGKLVIDNSILNNADLDLGVGEVVINSTITGKSKIDCGVGALYLNLTGDNYTIKGSKGVGSFKINNKNIKDNETYGNGSNIIDISGGVGSVEVNFK